MITVIVLLILVGVTIVTVTSENSLIQRGTYAEFATEYTTVKEKIALLVQEQEIDKIITDKTLKIKYPVTSEEIDITKVEDTLKQVIKETENLMDLTDKEKVLLYKVDLKELVLQTKREYVLNIKSGELYTLKGFKYKERVYHRLDQYEAWRKLAELAKVDITNYESFDQLLKDSIIVDKILSNKEAVEFLVKDKGTLLEVAKDNNNFLKEIINSENSDKFLQDNKWYSEIKNQNILSNSETNKLIPKLTKEKENSSLEVGQVWADMYTNGYEAYKAFDEDENTAWYLDDTSYQTTYPSIYYNFGKNTCIYRIYANFQNPTGSYSNNKFVFYISDDNINYKEIYREEWIWDQHNVNAVKNINVVFDKPVYAKYIKIYSELAATTYLPYTLTPRFKTIQLYGIR